MASVRHVDSDGVVTYSSNTIDNIYLGNTTESVDQRRERRVSRWSLLTTAKELLPHFKVASCMSCGSGGVVVRYSPSAGVASYSGIRTCGTVWHCPVCTAKISNRRRVELNKLLIFARKMGFSPLLVTLTVAHGSDDSLAHTLDSLKKAKRRLHQSKAWRNIAPRIVGFVTATEVTYGSHGWHPHYHMLVLVDADSATAWSLLDSLCPAWLAAVEREGYYASEEYGFDVQDAGKAGDYVSKWGAAEEMSLSSSKEGGSREEKGLSPWALLRKAHIERQAGIEDSEVQRLFVEYANCFAGRHQLVWSNGLKRIVGVVEKSDSDLASEPELEDMIEVGEVDFALWQIICRRMLQAELLTVAEQGADRASDYIGAWLQALKLQEEFADASED